MTNDVAYKRYTYEFLHTFFPYWNHGAPVITSLFEVADDFIKAQLEEEVGAKAAPSVTTLVKKMASF